MEEEAWSSSSLLLYVKASLLSATAPCGGKRRRCRVHEVGSMQHRMCELLGAYGAIQLLGGFRRWENCRVCGDAAILGCADAGFANAGQQVCAGCLLLTASRSFADLKRLARC